MGSSLESSFRSFSFLSFVTRVLRFKPKCSAMWAYTADLVVFESLFSAMSVSNLMNSLSNPGGSGDLAVSGALGLNYKYH